jgi:hypothetical protein
METWSRYRRTRTYEVPCGTDQVGNRVEFVMVDMRILIESYVVRGVCWREFISSLAMSG